MNEEEKAYEEELTDEEVIEINSLAGEEVGNVRNTTDIYRDYVYQIKDFEVLSKEEQFELFNNYKNGDMLSRDKLVEHNLKLVCFIANKLSRMTSIDIMDLIMEGNKGLMRALELFDNQRDVKFSSFAKFWVRHFIQRYIDNNESNIRIPVNIREIDKKINRAKNEYAMSNCGMQPSSEEIMRMAGISKSFLNKIEFTTNLNFEANIDAKIVGQEGEANTLGDTIEQTTAETPEEYINRTENIKMLTKVIDKLPKVQKDVAILRYGLKDGKFKTLEEVGEMLNVTREYVRQVEKKMLTTLRGRLDRELFVF